MSEAKKIQQDLHALVTTFSYIMTIVTVVQGIVKAVKPLENKIPEARDLEVFSYEYLAKITNLLPGIIQREIKILENIGVARNGDRSCKN
ncbi:MAG: hypothetical protein DRO40_08895 [Thermoprotei archaeon]|nr:MAG: hypothetical protein DRO40_08895 [Thermoprotei archaeon]